jgi:hypothetical protein
MHIDCCKQIWLSDDWVIIKGVCLLTGKQHATPPIPSSALDKYEAGAMVQDAFPMLSVAEREFLISGESPEGYKQARGQSGRTGWIRNLTGGRLS